MSGVGASVTVTDFSALGAMKQRAREDRDAALREVAQQFESLFIGMVLKSMRQAGLGEGVFDNQQSLMFRDLYDQQTAIEMGRAGGLGLADTLVRQLRRPDATPVAEDGDLKMPVWRVPASPGPPARVTPPDSADAAVPAATDKAVFDDAGDFIRSLRPAATRAARKLGVAPEALLAQAALESGWGRHAITHADGSPAYNLFGIKADSRWQGQRARVQTLEYEQGIAVRKRADFRAYESWEASFDDYADFIQANPRYAPALKQAADPRHYLRALQQAGYATDPRYADKIIAIMEGPRLAGS